MKMKSTTRTTTIRRPMNMAFWGSGFIEDALPGERGQRLASKRGQRARLWAESDTMKRAAIREHFWPEELQAMHDERSRNPLPLRNKNRCARRKDESTSPHVCSQE